MDRKKFLSTHLTFRIVGLFKVPMKRNFGFSFYCIYERPCYIEANAVYRFSISLFVPEL